MNFPKYALIGLLILTACHSKRQKADIAECSHRKHEVVEAGEASEMSLFHLTSTWTTQRSAEMQLQSLRGYKTVISMIYTSCQYACPRLVADMLAIEEGLTAEELEHTRFVLVSFDSHRDSPAKMHQFAEKMELDPDRWVLLNGDQADVMELAAVLGVKFKKTGDKDFSHSNIVSVLNEQGEIVFQQEGLGRAPREALEVLNHKILTKK